MVTEILIVGGGLSAAALVGSLRRRGSNAAITVLGAEQIPPYDRPPLSKELFERDAPVWLTEEFAIADGDATWVLGAAAAQLVPGGVVDDAGRVWRADQIVIATGVAPHVPWPDVRTLATWDDAHAVRTALDDARSTAIIGAGWLGLEIASAARSRGVAATVIDAASGPLGTLLPPDLSERIRGWLTESGAEFLGGVLVESADSRNVRVSGGVIAADCVIAALGSAPQTGWLPAELLAHTCHIRTDGDGRVRDGLWAIGDCAAPNGSAHPHWNDALASAERCAAALMEDDPPRPHVPHGYSTLFGRDAQILGDPDPSLTADVTETPGGGWTAQMSDGEELRAVLTVDSPREVARARKALAGH